MKRLEDRKKRRRKLKLYIIRHGQTEWNVERRLQGWKNSELTESGRRNAERLAEKLKDVDFDKIYTSTQKRAIDTGNIIKGDRDIELITLENLKERGFGSWEGMKIEEIDRLHGKMYKTYKETPHLYDPIDGESFEEIYARVNKALDEIISKKGENILVVSHGITIKIMISIIKEIPLERLNEIPTYEGTALSICQLDRDRLEFILEGDTSHIE